MSEENRGEIKMNAECAIESANSADFGSDSTESIEGQPIATQESIGALETRLKSMADKELRVELVRRGISGKSSAKKTEKIQAIIFHEEKLRQYI